MAKVKKQERRKNGEGSIYILKDGRYGAAVSLGKGEDGKRIRKVVTGQSEQEVKDKMQCLLEDNGLVDEPGEVIDPDINVSDYIVDFFNKTLRNRVKSRSILDYKYSISHFEKKYGEWPLKCIRIKQVNSFLEEMAELKDEKTGEYKYSQVTVNKAARMTKQILKRAKAKKIIQDNPCEDYDFKIPQSKAIRKKVESFEIDEISRLIKAVEPDGQLYPMVMLSLYTGMRTEELLALKWRCIDRKNKKIKIEIAQTLEIEFDGRFKKVKSSTIVDNTKNHGSLRDIIIYDNEIFGMLDKWKEYAAENTKTKFEADDFAFGNSKNEFFTYSGYRNKLLKYFKKNYPDIDGFKLHRLRHTAATLAVMKNVSIVALQSMLGHTQLSTTSGYVTRNKAIIESANMGLCTALKEIIETGKVITETESRAS